MSTTVHTVLFVVEADGISYGNIKYEECYIRSVSNLKSVLIYNASDRKQRPRERPSMLVV